jgi:signal transduction histidine kinase/CheY-like chemotaxis protein
VPGIEVRSEQVRTLYAQGRPILLANVVIALLASAVLFRSAPLVELVAWVSVTALLTLVRLALRKRYLALAPPAADAELWGRRFAVGGGAAGLLWGLAAWGFLQPGDAVTEAVLTFAIAGNTAGAAGTQSCYMPAFLAYFYGALTPFALRVALVGDALHATMAAMIGVYGGVLVVVARNTHRVLVESLRLRFDNAALVDRLSSSQFSLERVNAELEQRVRERTLELEQQAVALQAARQMEAVGRLAAGVAHDFNNLLTVVTANAKDLLDRPGELPNARSALEDVVHAGERGADLVRQLLAFGRQQHLEPRVFDLNDLVQQDGRLLARLIGEHIALSFQLEPGPLHVRADQVQVRQVLVNLVTNGRDAMPQGGPLVVRTTSTKVVDRADLAAGDYVILAVRDAGVGMSPETAGRVFDPFFTTKGVGRGTGLGLATVHGIAFQSGGAVEVLTTPGEGTEFRVYLPRASDVPRTVSELASPPSASVPPAKATILLAEDDPELRSVLRRILTRMGHEVITAESGQEALAVAAGRAEVPLLVTDVLMPGLGGLEVYERLRARWPNLRVLFVSGYAAGERMPSGVSGQVAFLAKPFSPDALRQQVTAMLAAT